MRTDGLPDNVGIRRLLGIPQRDLAAMTVDQIMRDTGVSQSSAYKHRRIAKAEVEGSEAPESLKSRILVVVQMHEPISDVDGVRRLLESGDSYYDITKALWGLQKSGDVTFRESKHGRDSILTTIRLAKGTTFRPIQVEHKRRRPVGRDMTDPQHHGAQAVGGQIERSVVAHEPETSIQRYSAPEPLPQNMKPFIGEESGAGYSPQADVMSAEVDGNGLASDTHTQYPDVRGSVDNWQADYPLIAELMGKRERLAAYETAAKALEETDAEMALALLEKIQLTDLEKEVISFVEIVLDGS